ncbi:hypothetical protein R1flu_027646 [Riccia fluitans]|uniref:Uncharacterized protein n=1 Tax=Riccia fluitans TaxID=41844 RepID=A0ABD1XNG1_9MARC
MEVVPSLEREVQELSSSSSEQLLKKEPRVEQTSPWDDQRQEDAPSPRNKETTDEDVPIAFRRRRMESQIRELSLTIGEPRRDQPARRQEPPIVQGQAGSTPEPPRRFRLLG